MQLRRGHLLRSGSHRRDSERRHHSGWEHHLTICWNLFRDIARVEDRMRLSKDKKSISINPSITLSGIPSEVFQYRPGNRIALEWVIDQYQVTEDHRTGIRSDPNRADDEEYIVRLVGQVIQVSLETVRIVSALPKDYSG
ncbi:MAG TPA: type ISP restriction/modification enzyme [Terriglobia bacterium]|nr:type ISP restriction/modification enzyme [Terriglobia bacterium]